VIRENPFLGPKWEPLAQALAYVIGKTASGRTFHFQTYLRKYGLSPDTSPYLQAIIEDEFFHLEISGNLVLNPPLDEEGFSQMEFYGWQRPEASPEVYHDNHEGNPNFVRYFSLNTPIDEVVEFLLTTLAGVFEATEDDFYAFTNGNTANEVDGLHLLGRLKKTEANPDQVIFAFPGKHLDMVDRPKSRKK